MKISPPIDPVSGQAIDNHQRYVLTRRIGDGGMGEVFLATDTLLGRSVALKLLSSKLATEPMRKRFEREVAVCAALRSDHIVQVFDYGVTAEGYPFYVMEYLEGQTLGQLLKQKKRLSVEQTVNLITQVCAGLHLAHQGVQMQWHGTSSSQLVKVVHRDLKPDNIFLVPTALGEFVKILDFGIAKIRSDHIEHTHVTDMFMGTYQYASPEQLRAEKDLDERADIYSLGMILYKMLTGTAPFDFTFEQQADLQPSGAVWAVAHLTKPPIPLRQQPGCEHLPLQLEAALMRCLQKSPKQRFSSVMELSQALRIAAKQDNRNSVEMTYSGPVPEEVEVTVTEEASDPPEQSPTEITEECILPEYALPHTLAHDAAETTRLSTSYRRSTLPIPLLIGVGVGIATALAIGSVALLRSFPLLTAKSPAPSPPVSSPSSPSPVPLQPLSASQSLQGHTDTIWAIAISPDGKTLASGSFDKTIRLWDLSTRTWRQSLSGHTDAVRAIAISADNKTLVSGSSDKTIKIWNLQTGALIRTIAGHAGPVWALALSPDSKILASGSYDGTIKTWDLQSGKLLQTIPEDYGSIWSVAISPDGKTLASGSYGSTVKIWNLQTGELLRTLSGHADRVLAVAIAPKGQTIASGGVDHTVKLWDLQTGTLLNTLSGHSDWVISVAFSPSGETLASGSKDKTIQLWHW